MSADEDVEVRLVRCPPLVPSAPSLIAPSLDAYDVEVGPFEYSYVSEVVTSSSPPFSFLLNDVDRFLPSLADWMSAHFSFVPNWRRDDGQVSLSSNGGGIGLHVDDYDVFLVQTGGERSWTVELQSLGVAEELDRSIPNLPLRILSPSPSCPYATVALQPGDMLYIPPRFPHKGVATSDRCMTLSVGFRAPSSLDMLSDLVEFKSEEPSHPRFDDIDLQLPSSPGLITPGASDRARSILRDSVAEFLEDDSQWGEFFGKIASRSKRVRLDYPRPLDDEDKLVLGEWGDAEAAVEAVLKQNRGMLVQAEGVVFAYDQKERLFVNGEVFETGSCESKHLSLVCDSRFVTGETLKGYEENEDFVNLLRDLVSVGYLYGCDEE
ncbi:hypothetical protein TrRE_jg11368 [Triparma retinervis]|uniref:Bifunctional lysine-specific demethylase and histidyl-hydroxylase n=1 Tax=Triparma retinervis TaxID=2557542 RepID=A0A9W7G0S6_9STRA|nr:hypothetical protein TrRE_jg11368 [Triparma retinervis]